MDILEVRHVKKNYGVKKGEVITEALKDVSFSVKPKEFVAIMGESGSGKSTLLNIVSTLDAPTFGEVKIANEKIKDIPNSKLALFRRKKLGFVFQDFNLLNSFNNKDNILLPLVLSGEKLAVLNQRLAKVVDLLNIQEIVNKYPYQISGGQKQKVAIARAIITNPEIIFADEPTGSLDSNSSNKIMELFTTLNQKGQTIMMVTHSSKAAAYANRVLFIKDGIIYHEIYRGQETNDSFNQRIIKSLSILEKGVDDYEK